MAKPGLAILFFVSFTVIASLVILSMFIGTISLSMGESIQQLNKEILMKKQRKRARQVAKKMERMKSSTRIKTAEQVRLEEATTGVASATGDLKKKSEVGVTHFAALRAAMFPYVANHHSSNQVAVDFLLGPLTNHHHSVIPPSLLHTTVTPSYHHHSFMNHHHSFMNHKSAIARIAIVNPVHPTRGPCSTAGTREHAGTRRYTPVHAGARVHLRVPVNRVPACQYRIGISTCCRCNPIGVVTSDT